MNSVLLFCIIFSAIKSSHSYICAYVNNTTESVILKCGRPREVISTDTCTHDLFKSNSMEINRLEVEQLKLIDRWCVNYDDDIDDLFANIRDFDISFTAGSSYLSSHNMNFKYLEKFNASHCQIEIILRGDFQSKKNLKEIDLSFNKISQFSPDTFENNVKLTMINLTNNILMRLDPGAFSKLGELKVLDISSNRLDTLDKDIFRNSPKLEILRMEMNHFKRFDCNWFLPVENLKSLSVSLDDITELDLSCDRTLMYFDWNNASDVILRLPTVENDLRFKKDGFKNLEYFNVNGNRFQNISEILNLLGAPLKILDLSGNFLGNLESKAFEKFVNLERLSLSDTHLDTQLKVDGESETEPTLSHLALSFSSLKRLKSLDVSKNFLQNLNFSSLSPTLSQLTSLNIANTHLKNIADPLNLLSPSGLESLDVSQNYVGRINADTFRQFTNLQYLNVSQTHLSNFRFGTFYHQSKLRTLDISQNYLKNIDFTLFTRRFNNLTFLNLEGNNLTDINSVNMLNFPKLESLGISKNQFSCHYLLEFLGRWRNLKVIENPSDGTHIDGIDCFEGENGKKNGGGSEEENDGENNEKTTNIGTLGVTIDNNNSELRAIKYLLLFLCFLFCGYLINKSNIISRMRHKLPRNSESNVIYRQTTMNKEHSIGLIQAMDK